MAVKDSSRLTDLIQSLFHSLSRYLRGNLKMLAKNKFITEKEYLKNTNQCNSHKTSLHHKHQVIKTVPVIRLFDIYFFHVSREGKCLKFWI